MDIDKQVTSFEISQELEKLGVKQDSLWYWVKDHESKFPCFVLEQNEDDDWKSYCRYEYYSAFTVAELGEMLPWSFPSVNTFGYLRAEYDEDEKWTIFYEQRDRSTIKVFEYMPTEADARGRMLCYLIEKGLMKV